jgi:hypothetical protein
MKIACDDIGRKLERMIADVHLWVQAVGPSLTVGPSNF